MPKTDVEKLSEINDLFDFILKVQDKLAPEVVSPQETQGGEGRKGVIMVRGDNKWTKIFEVKGGRLIPASSIDGARTVIVFEGIDIFRNVCQELLAGNPGAFSRARARGEVKVVGEYAIRDLSIFNRLLSKVGRILTGYNVKLGGEQ